MLLKLSEQYFALPTKETDPPAIQSSRTSIVPPHARPLPLLLLWISRMFRTTLYCLGVSTVFGCTIRSWESFKCKDPFTIIFCVCVINYIIQLHSTQMDHGSCWVFEHDQMSRPRLAILRKAMRRPAAKEATPKATPEGKKKRKQWERRKKRYSLQGYHLLPVPIPSFPLRLKRSCSPLVVKRQSNSS